MSIKYYTPSIEEFHVGFEYEFKDWHTLKGHEGFVEGQSPRKYTEDDWWVKTTLKKEDLWEWRTRSREELAEMQSSSIGVVGNPGADYRHTWERITTGIKDGTVRVKCLDTADLKELGFEQVWSEFEEISYTNRSNILIQIYPQNRIFIGNNNIQDKYMSVLFRGIIKNKSELKILLKQLNVS